MKLESEIALQFALGMLETFSRQDFALVLAGVRKTASGRELDRLVERWHRQQVITRVGRGCNARFRITDRVRDSVRASDPAAEWGRHWDGRWRVFCFDLPERRRKDRARLWVHLRAARFGLLQRSVWVWPHDVESSLRAMVQAQGIPECFCGFDSGRLFLCRTAEIVASAWDWRAIHRDHTVYLRKARDLASAVQRLSRPADLARIAGVECNAYRAAFKRDPLLPRALWATHYQGVTVWERHCEIQGRLRDRIREAGEAQLPFST